MRGPGVLLAALSGILLALAYPPLSLWWLAYVALVPLYRVLISPHPPCRTGAKVSLRALRGTAMPGFSFALVLFGVGMFWMNALATPLWAILCVIQGVFFGIWAIITRKLLLNCPGWLRPLVFASLWTLFEWTRSLGVYAFPWFLLASSQTHPDALPFVQAADLGGQWLVSFVIAAINGYLAESLPISPFAPRNEGSAGGGAEPPASAGVVGWLIALALFLILGLYGVFARAGFDSKALNDKGKFVPVAIVQGSENKSADWDGRLSLYLELTRGVEKSALVVWPEGSVHENQFPEVDKLARQSGTPILTGLAAYGDLGGESRPRNIARLTGSPKEYVKRRLAPFGEVYPFRKQLASVYQKFGVNNNSYVTGEKPEVFESDGLFVGPIICYESAFPWATRATVRDGASVLAFLTSDQTFDGTPELSQHLALAQLRCIETRRYGLRAASSGISAVITPTGHIEARLENGKRGVIPASVTPLSGRTLAVTLGDWWLLVCAALAFEATRRAVASARSGRSA